MYLNQNGTDFSSMFRTGTLFGTGPVLVPRPDQFGPERIQLRTGPAWTGLDRNGLVWNGPWLGHKNNGWNGIFETDFHAEWHGPDFLERKKNWTGTDRILGTGFFFGPERTGPDRYMPV